MKHITSVFYALVVLCAIAVMPACKAKKLVQQPAPVAQTPPPPPPPVAPPPPTAQTPPPAVAATPDYNFSNIQFEFNSGILKTDSYPLLDKAAAQMKMDPSVKFMLSGYASAEGTADHNLSLSADRANAVKAYLVNSGISAGNLSTKGYGESNPVADNTTEDGRVLNRRVEIKKLN